MLHELTRRSLEVFLLGMVVGCSIWVTIVSVCLGPYGT